MRIFPEDALPTIEASSLPEVDINELQFKLIHMLAPSGGSRPRGMHDQESRPPSLANKFNVRVAKYKRFQRLFQNNRRKLASHLLDGTFLDQFKGNVDEATAHPQNTLSSRPLLPTIEEAAGSDTPGVSITQPILAEEVARELKAARPSAAGPDGLKMLYLQKLKAADFASLFNIWLAHHNRTPRFGCAVAALLPAMLEGWKLKNILMGPMAIYFFNSSGNGENDLEELDFREKLPRPSTCGRVSDPIDGGIPISLDVAEASFCSMADFKKIFYFICLSLLIMQSSELYVFIDATNVLSGRSYRVCAQHEPDSSKLASSKSEAIPYKLVFWNTDDDYWCEPLSRNASFANCVVYGLHESKNSSECGPHSASIVSRLRYLHEHDGDVALFLEDDLSFSYFDPTIPFGFLNMSIYFIDNYWFQKILDLSENPRNSSNIHLRFYSPVNWTVAITPVVLVVIALFALMVGSYWAGYKHDIALKMRLRLAEAYRKIIDGNGASASDSTRANNFENSRNSKASNIQSNLRTLFCALFMSVGLLLFLFFAYDYAIWFILSIYVFSAYVSLYDCFSHLIPNCLFCHKEIPLNCLKAIFSYFTKRSDSRNWSVPFKRIFLCFFCLTLTISWFVFRKQWYVVVLQNILGLAILISVVSNVRLPTLKAVTVFSLAFLIYDVTMVFISPYFTNGCSIMLDVVTGGGCSKGRGAVVNVENAKEMLPLMIVVPQLTDLAVSCAKLSGIYSLMPTSLGFGDVIIPGIMVGFNAAFDRSWNIRYNLYFIVSSIGYLLGLVVTLTILLITGSALCRGEVLKMWRGEFKIEVEDVREDGSLDTAAQ
ncbi:Signal peptide peptidase-like 2B [Trichinella pseudospiralis]